MFFTHFELGYLNSYNILIKCMDVLEANSKVCKKKVFMLYSLLGKVLCINFAKQRSKKNNFKLVKEQNKCSDDT